MNLRRRVVATLPFLLLLGACSEAPKPTVKKEVKPAEPVTALAAVYKMYQQARGWAPDCQVLRVGSLDVKEMKGQDGKMGAWEATFVSPSQRQSRRYTYSVVESPASNLSLGVSAGTPDVWSPVGQTRPFIIQSFKTDSTEAYATAMTKAKEYAAKHPDVPVTFLLEWAKRHLNPTWRVIWGTSAATSGFSVYVDATYGKYLSTAH
jgi:hypothetical protein